MDKTSGRASVIHGKAITALKLACLPAVLLLANCNAPAPPPQAPSTTTVVERPQIVERPRVVEQAPVTVDLNLNDADRKRRDDEQHRRDEEQRQRDDHPH